MCIRDSLQSALTSDLLAGHTTRIGLRPLDCDWFLLCAVFRPPGNASARTPVNQCPQTSVASLPSPSEPSPRQTALGPDRVALSRSRANLRERGLQELRLAVARSRAP
eukprot:1607087-Alexandrium_andersonii.AAC.1